MEIEYKNIILFDGICNLCNSSVQLVIRNDRKALYHFASIQSSVGQELLQKYQVSLTALSSFVLIENGTVYLRSTAALRVAKQLDGLWSLLYCAIIIPRFIRDGMYNFIAAHRYQWFGQQSTCYLPTKELESRFLDNLPESDINSR